MTNLFGFLKKSTTSEPAESVSNQAPGTGIHYDPKLIGKLKKEHAVLLTLWGSIGNSVAEKNLQEINNLLLKFKAEINNHLLTENVRLYVYLTHYLEDDKFNSEIINDFREEMNRIGRTVTTFLRTYTSSPIKESQLTDFKEQFDAIGKALVDRISREESTLYELYME